MMAARSSAFSDTAPGTTHAFSWTRADGMVDLGVLPGDNYSKASGVNDRGEVAGNSTTASGAEHATRRRMRTATADERSWLQNVIGALAADRTRPRRTG